MGDACDPDADNDGILNESDNCPLVWNTSQADMDKDGIGDVCDDSDGDGVPDSIDNCMYSGDFDGDGFGDACDLDNDNDGICDKGSNLFSDPSEPPGGCPTRADNCPRVKNASQIDSDNDGYGDACDTCPAAPNTGDTDNDGIDNACDLDDDNDGVPDTIDNCPTVPNPDQRDINRNGVGSACDPSDVLTLGISPGQIHGAIQFRRERFERFQILILPDCRILPNCRPFGQDWIPENLFVEIKVQLEIDLPMRIIDDQGFVVAQAQFGREKILRFHPKPDFFYRPPSGRHSVSEVGSEKIKPYQGRKYFLKIFPSREVDPDRPYKIRIEAMSGTQR
jgi:hypothetical protein